jgi:hypothetical protein
MLNAGYRRPEVSLPIPIVTAARLTPTCRAASAFVIPLATTAAHRAHRTGPVWRVGAAFAFLPKPRGRHPSIWRLDAPDCFACFHGTTSGSGPSPFSDPALRPVLCGSTPLESTAWRARSGRWPATQDVTAGGASETTRGKNSRRTRSTESTGRRRTSGSTLAKDCW